MNELDVSLKVAHAFQALGYDADKVQDAIVCPRCNNKMVPSRGRPDRAMIHPSARSCYVEAKVVRPDETSFSFSEINAEQRATLDNWRARGGIGYLALGIIRRPKRNDRLSGLYLIEWSRWRALESLVTPHQNSIPVVAGAGFSKAIQDGQLDIQRQLWQWALEPIKGGWAIPDRHPATEQLRLKEMSANE